MVAFCTAAPELALSYPGIDMVAIGEGEYIISEVAERIRKSKM